MSDIRQYFNKKANSKTTKKATDTGGTEKHTKSTSIKDGNGNKGFKKDIEEQIRKRSFVNYKQNNTTVTTPASKKRKTKMVSSSKYKRNDYCKEFVIDVLNDLKDIDIFEKKNNYRFDIVLNNKFKTYYPQHCIGIGDFRQINVDKMKELRRRVRKWKKEENVARLNCAMSPGVKRAGNIVCFLFIFFFSFFK